MERYRRVLPIVDDHVQRGQFTEAVAVLENIGKEFYREQRYNDAESAYRKAIEVRKLEKPVNAREVAKMCSLLAKVQMSQENNLPGAEQSLASAVTVLKEAGLDRSEDVVSILTLLSQLHIHMFKVHDANLEVDHARDLVNELQLSKTFHADLWLMSAEARYARGDYQSALSFAQELRGQLDTTGKSAEEYVINALLLRESGNNLLAMGNLAHAEKAFLDYHDAMLRGFGRNSLYYADSLCSLAEINRESGRIDDAAVAAENAHRILLNHDNANRAQLARVQVILASVCIEKGDLEKAEEHLQAAMEAYRTCYSTQHPCYATALMYTSDIHYKRGHFIAVESTLKEALVIFETTYGPENPLLRPILVRQESLMRKGDRVEMADSIRNRISALEVQAKKSK